MGQLILTSFQVNDKNIVMATLRAYIKNNQSFLRERDNITDRPNQYHHIRTHSNRSALVKAPTYQLSPTHLPKKQSLPPISEFVPRGPKFSLELKRSQALSRYFKDKNQSLVSNRSKTEQKQSSPRSRFSVNLSEWRMRPLDKYFYKMENIRLAERLLVVKPSVEVSRKSCKKFFSKQKHYSSQISHSPSSKKPAKQKIKSNKLKQIQLEQSWVR